MYNKSVQDWAMSSVLDAFSVSGEVGTCWDFQNWVKYVLSDTSFSPQDQTEEGDSEVPAAKETVALGLEAGPGSDRSLRA